MKNKMNSKPHCFLEKKKKSISASRWKLMFSLTGENHFQEVKFNHFMNIIQRKLNHFQEVYIRK